MFVSLSDKLVLLLYQEIGLQSNKDSRRSTFGYVYTPSGFFVVSIATKKAFWLLGSSLSYIV